MLFSIVLPIYNVEKYIRESLESILAQRTDKDYEVIMVDDGSKDGSGLICDEYAEKYDNFKVLHTVNQGVSAARNLGISESRGDYILFLDPDDFWAPELMETVAPLCDGRDMVLFNCADFYDDTGRTAVREMYPLPEKGESGREYLERLAINDCLPAFYMWACAFRRDFITENNIKVDTNFKCSEDFDFNMQCYLFAESLGGTDKCLYYYRQHSLSTTAAAIHSDRIMTNLILKEKWYRKVPKPAMADLYICQTLLLADLCKGEDASEPIAFIKKNRDIIDVSQHRNFKILKLLYRVFGYRRGAVIYRKLQHITKG